MQKLKLDKLLKFKGSKKDLSISPDLLFQSIFETTPNPILITNKQGLICYVNPAWIKLTGYSLEEAIDKNPRFLESGLTPKRIYKQVWKNLELAKTYQTESIINKKKDGSMYQTLSTFFPIRNDQENFLYMQVSQDITKRKKLEKKLKIQEQQFRLLFEEAPIGISMANKFLKPIRVNTFLCKMLGYKEQELLKKTFTEITYPDDKPKTIELANKLYAEKISQYTYEKRYFKKNGEIIWVNVKGKLIRDQHNKPIYGMGIIEDITARKQLELQRSVFLSVATHELKTPITTISLMLQLLAKRLSKNKSLHSDFLTIDRELKRLTALINQLLDLSRLETGKMKVTPTIINLADFLTEAVKSISMYSNHKIELEKPLKVEVIADQYKIEQVLINLVTNAIKHSQSTEPVKVSYKKSGNKIIISVSDKGQGIPKNKLPFIFDKFYQGNEESVKGFGLGLFICKEIIELHNEKIWVKSIPGKETTFSFSLSISK